MIFANIEYLFLLILLHTLYNMVRHEAEENRAYASGFYHTHVHEGTQKSGRFTCCMLRSYSVRWLSSW